MLGIILTSIGVILTLIASFYLPPLVNARKRLSEKNRNRKCRAANIKAMSGRGITILCPAEHKDKEFKCKLNELKAAGKTDQEVYEDWGHKKIGDHAHCNDFVARSYFLGRLAKEKDKKKKNLIEEYLDSIEKGINEAADSEIKNGVHRLAAHYTNYRNLFMLDAVAKNGKMGVSGENCPA